MLNDWALPPMSYFGVRCAGHEGAGVVVKKGAKVSDAWKVGDRVGVKPLSDVCHNCEECWNGRELHILLTLSPVSIQESQRTATRVQTDSVWVDA